MPLYEINSGIIGHESLNGGKILKPKYRHYVNKTGLFGDIQCQVVAMSDIHSLSIDYVKKLVKTSKINDNTIVIMTGDMAGTGRTGPAGDADPYEMYLYVLENCRSLYFVQGNHDIYNDLIYELKNTDGTPCCLDNIVVTTPLGRMGGVNGVISDTPNRERHKLEYNKYMEKYNRVKGMGPDIVLTHQPPETDMIYAKLHLFGHAHAKKYYYELNGSTCVNMDSRILIMI